MKYEYTLISAEYSHNFNELLNEHVIKGWEPFGSICSSGTYGEYFYLLMRKEINTES